MPRYVRFEKKTSRGVLAHDVAMDGLILRERSRRGVNVTTGKVGGGRSSTTSTHKTEAGVRTAFDARVKALLAERFVQVGGPPLPAAPAAPKARSKALRGKGSSEALRGKVTSGGTPKPAAKKELDAFEEKHGIRLPLGYRRFAMKYGACELLGFVRIHVPRAKGRQRLESLARWTPDGLFPFADTGGGDLFGWHLPSPAIHYLERGAERTRKVAPDCDALVRGLTKDQRFVERLFGGLDPDPTVTAR